MGRCESERKQIQRGQSSGMESNAEVDFTISAEDMETLKNFKKIESYGASSGFPVYGGKL